MLKNILVFAHCFYTEKAVMESYYAIAPPDLPVNFFYFKERLKFLVTATVLNDSDLIIDATRDRDGEYISLIDKIILRNFKGQIIVILKDERAKKEIDKKGCLIKIKFIYSVNGLNSELSKAVASIQRDSDRKRVFGALTPCLRKETCGQISDYLKCRVQRRVSHAEFTMMTNWKDYKYWARQVNTSYKSIINRRYTLRKKLHLDSLTEYYCLVNIISSTSGGQSSVKYK